MLSNSQEALLQAHREIDLRARTSGLPFVSGWDTVHDVRYEHLEGLRELRLAVMGARAYHFISDDESLKEKTRGFHALLDEKLPSSCDVFLGAGSSPLLSTLLMWLSLTGESELLYVAPMYHAYYQLASSFRIRLTLVGQAPLAVEELVHRLPDRRSVLLVTDPAWVLGLSHPAELWRGLRAWQARTGSLVIVDGTFSYTKWQAMSREDACELDPELSFRLVCPTKSLCVHGIRFAYLILPTRLVEDYGWLYCKLVAASSAFDIGAAHLLMDQLSSASNNRQLVALSKQRYDALRSLGHLDQLAVEPACTYYAFGRSRFAPTSVLSMNGRYFELDHPDDWIRINLLSPALPLDQGPATAGG